MTMIPPFFLEAVVSIGIDSKEPEKTNWIGTGFLVGRKEDEGRHSVYLITNKHVLANHEELHLLCNSKDGTKTKDFYVETGTGTENLTYTPHPDKDVDICAIHINCGVLREGDAEYNYFALEEHALTLERMRETGVSEGTLVYALGFPMNLVCEKKKAPICRLGCISRISDLYVENNDSKQYLVDAESYPGNSGSPVINCPECVSIEGTQHNSSANLIGILNGHISYNETLYSSQTGEAKSIRTENSGLTRVFPVDYIIQTVDLERKRVGLDKSAMK